MFPNLNMINNNTTTTNQANSNNLNVTPMKMPVMGMGIPVFFPSFIMSPQDQTPVGERCKIWVGKIPDGISETFMKKLLECCGQITSWRRVTNSSGKLNSFGLNPTIATELVYALFDMSSLTSNYANEFFAEYPSLAAVNSVLQLITPVVNLPDSELASQGLRLFDLSA